MDAAVNRLVIDYSIDPAGRRISPRLLQPHQRQLFRFCLTGYGVIVVFASIASVAADTISTCSSRPSA